MSKMFAPVLPLLAVLTLVLPGKTVAGPPEGVSGKMVLQRDGVAEALWMYRQENDEEKRILRLVNLLRIRDPRVAVALGKALDDPCDCVRTWGAIGIVYYQMGVDIDSMPGEGRMGRARKWWEQNEADLRRRAKQLPQ
jgi:hypothetical protein